MKKITMAVLVGAALVGGTAAQAQSEGNRWVYMGNADDGTHEYVQPGYDGDQGYRRVWLKSTNDPDLPAGHYEIALTQFDCAEHREQTMHATQYNARGDVVREHGAFEWSYIEPDSVADHIVGLACADRS